MKYKVEMQHIITFVVEADSEEQFIDWAAEVTPMEARGIINGNGRSVQTEDYYDTVLEVLPDDTEAGINIREEGKMNIIPAKQLNCKNKRADIIQCFIDNLMIKIQEKANVGKHSCVFNATVYYHKETGQIKSRLSKGYIVDEWEFGKYSFCDYEDEVEAKFREYGYIVRPIGYIGGVLQKGKEICW